MILGKRKMMRKLRAIGSHVDTSYLLYLNNNADALRFESRDDLNNYIQSYRQDNEIFKIQIFRIETYSL